MKSILLTAACAASLFAAPAYAAGNSNNNGPTKGGDTTVTNANANVNHNAGGTGIGVGHGGSAKQGQAQGQLQGQSQTASSDQSQGQIQSLDAHNSIYGNTTTASSAGQQASQTVTVAGDEAQRRNPVSTAYAAPLTVGGGVCAYTPVSGSGQFVSFGLSGSGAKIDKGCERRATADMFARMGMKREACLIMMRDPQAAFLGEKTCD